MFRHDGSIEGCLRSIDSDLTNPRDRNQMTSYKTSSDLRVDDLFHARFSGYAKRICVVTSMDATSLMARAITTQEVFRFDRTSGVSDFSELNNASCAIDSIIPLPQAMRDTLLGYDLRCRTSNDPDAARLSVAERQALLDAGRLYAANPLAR